MYTTHNAQITFLDYTLTLTEIEWALTGLNQKLTQPKSDPKLHHGTARERRTSQGKRKRASVCQFVRWVLRSLSFSLSNQVPGNFFPALFVFLDCTQITINHWTVHFVRSNFYLVTAACWVVLHFFYSLSW